MAGVKKLANGNYEAWFRDPSGKEKTKQKKREKDALDWLVKELSAIDRGEYVDSRRGRITVGECVPTWLAGRVDLKPKTLAGYESLLRTHILPRWQDVQLRHVTNADVVAWIAEMRKRGLSASRTRQTAGVLSMVLAAAVRDRRIASNPAADVNLPRHVSPQHRYLRHAELHALADACGYDAVFVLVLGYCGLRFGEAAALRVRNIDLMRRRIRITEAVVEVNGHQVFGTTKNHQARSVPIPPIVADRLAVQLAGRKGSDFAFPARRGGAIWNGTFRKAVWDRACVAVGLGEYVEIKGRNRYRGLVPHELRHTAASLAIAAGANIKVIQTMLGHKTATMTWDLYGHLYEDDLDVVAQRLDAAARADLADFSRTNGTAAVVDLDERRFEQGA
jgi:integrase